MEKANFFSLIILIFIVIISLILKYIREKKQIKSTDEKAKLDIFCNKNYKKIWLIFSIIIFITVIYKFGEIPKYIGVDEAGMIYDAYCLSEYGTDRYLNSYPLYLVNFGGGQSSLCAYLVSVSIKILGTNMIAYRLPVLLVYLISVIVSYLLISKAKDRKTALLFTFLIITCPWNIFNSRMALDCNLYAGLFMLDLYFLNKAEKSYQYVIAGIFIGLTLYTYSLSWITMPIFLLVWCIYMLYIKKIKIKQIIIMGIPIAIFAMPLIYFLLVNYGIVNNTKLGIFTLPVLTEFRQNEINILNIYRTGLESLNTIFFAEGTIYLVYVPLFVIGYVLEFKNAIQKLKEKQYNISIIMIIAFTTILIGLLTTRIPTPNKANVLYIPILYFVTIAILNICNNFRMLLIVFITMILMLCVNYEVFYYTIDGVNKINWYEDLHLTEITKLLEENEQTRNTQKYIFAYRSQPQIYNLIELKLSPNEYMNTVKVKKYIGGAERIVKVGETYNYLYLESEVKQINLEKQDYIFVISNSYEDTIEYLKNNNYKSINYGTYTILTKGIEISVSI